MFMKFLNSYFNDQASLEQLNQEFDSYSHYLRKHYKAFDEKTFQILYKGLINDCTIEKLSFNTYWGDNEEHLADIQIILEYNEKRFLCCYKAVSYFSFPKEFYSEFGFDAILISECLIFSDYFEHTLYFVGNIPLVIKCQRMYIENISNISSF